MALTAAEEAQTRELLAQQAAILSLADSEAEIISNLGATDVSLSDLTAATVIDDADLLLIRQGVTDKSIAGSIVKAVGSQPDASETVKGIVELATPTETINGISDTLAVHPAGLNSALSAISGSVVGIFSNLKASATGLNANVSVTADEIVVESSANAYKTLRAVSLTVAGTSVGANGIDAGTIATSTWYSLWVIWNGTTTAGLMSLSATAPTLPSGYTHKARIGWIRTDGTANKYPLSFKQYGNRTQYAVAAGTNVPSIPAMASGAAGTPGVTLVAVAMGAFVPPTAATIDIRAYQVAGTSNVIQVAPNSVAGFTSSSGIIVAGTSVNIVGAAEFVIESTNLYWSSIGATNQLSCSGWTDNI